MPRWANPLRCDVGKNSLEVFAEGIGVLGLGTLLMAESLIKFIDRLFGQSSFTIFFKLLPQPTKKEERNA